MPEPADPVTFVVRFPAPGGGTAGLGALVHSRHIITCAHVVNTALGRHQRAQDKPNGPLTVEFPLLPGHDDPPSRLRAEVAVWRPPSTGAVGGDDIAGLVLDRDPPDGAVPARLSAESPRPGLQVGVFGYPGAPPRPDGGWVFAAVRGTVGNGRLQLDSGPDSSLRVQPGFSGSPVYDDVAGRVVGMLATAPQAGTDRDSYAISTGRIRRAWPEVLPGSRERAAIRRRNSESAELTILHVSGTRFTGEEQRPFFADLHHDLADLADQYGLRPDLLVVTGDLADRGRPSEFRQAVRFLDELSKAAEIERRHVAVVPGGHDVNRKDCEAYFTRMEGGEEEPVAPYFPKWERYHDALFDGFYASMSALGEFTPDQPFTLFEMPDLNVVVAGLNSTFADSHLDPNHQGSLDEEQLAWFRGKLEECQGRGWLRVAAVYHGDPAGLRGELGDLGPVHLLLHHGVPGTHPRRLPSGAVVLATGGGRYQLVTVRPDGITRHARRYAAGENLWTGDTGIHPGRADWRDRTLSRLTDVQEAFPPGVLAGENLGESAGESQASDLSVSGAFPTLPVRRNEFLERVNEFLERVAEATRVRFPHATVTERPERSYLRVSVPRDGGGTEQRAIGVIDGPPSWGEVKEFADRVHDRFASADPSLPRSELVYSAAAAVSDELAEYARRRGIRLKSMVEYQQDLLDLTRLTEAQRERLATDRDYLAELYIEQRYRIVHGSGSSGGDGGGGGDRVRVGLVAQAVDWLGAEQARLVVVLGDFGRGKTAFLRQLTRVLPTRLPAVVPGRPPAVVPVLVELGPLEKGPSLDDLLAQHLIRHDIEDFSQDKLRYMINSGRVALLFDGLDELELRVGYKNAAEYLRKLLGSVSAAGQAKVILTSRTQHFRSTDEVRTALGQQVESRAASRVVVLEEFSDEQMTEFLTRLYDGDEQRTRERLDQVRGIGNLVDLAHNPRMLSFIASLDADRMRAALDDAGRVNAAGLYEQIIDFWLEFEAGRQRYKHGPATFTKDQRFDACTKLALRLWRSGDPHLALADLDDEVTKTLSDLVESGFTREQAAHAIAAGSLLVRIGDGVFTFIHQSVMEWFVAKAAVSDHEILSQGQFSGLMAEFVTDLAGAGAVSGWAAQALVSGSDTARKNVVALTKKTNEPPERIFADSPSPRMNLAGLDLRGQDLTDRNLRNDLRGADLRGANLSGMVLDGVDLTGADLSDADLTGVMMVGGSLLDAILTGSKWNRAAILGPDGLAAVAGSPELAVAAMPGRDPHQAMFVPPGECDDVAFSGDGTLLAVARGRAVQLIDAVDGTTLRVLHGHIRHVTGVAFSPDGTVLATASRDRTALLWDVSTGAGRGTLTGHDGGVTAVAFSPDGGLVATASRDRTARIWDTATGRTRTTFSGHDAPVTAVAFSPDGRLLATASTDGTARTWDAASGLGRETFTGHERAVTAVAFSPDGRLLATGSDDRTARIWDTGTGTEPGPIDEYPQPVTAVAFSPDGRLLAAAYGTRTDILDTVSGIRRTTLRGRDRRVNGVAFSPDGTLLATVSADGAGIWNLESRVQHFEFTRFASPVTAVAFSPDGSLLATADQAGAIRTWDTRTGTRRAAFPRAHSLAVTGIAFSPDGSLLATASRDGTIRTWNARTGEQRSTQRRSDPVAVAFSPDGTRLAAASLDGAVRIWNAGSEAGVIGQDLGPAIAMAFSADGAFLAAAAADGTSVGHAVSSGATIAKVTTHSGPSGQVSAMAVSPDGTFLAIASPRGTVDVWDTRTREWITAFSAHALAVTSVAFSPGGTTVLTGSDDGTARTWDARTGRPRAVLVGHTDSVRAVAFSADGSLVATGSSDGTARVWDAGSGREIATLISLPGGGYATLLPGGGYKLSDEADDIWWAVKLCRFGPGELDPYVREGLRRLPLEEPLIC